MLLRQASTLWGVGIPPTKRASLRTLVATLVVIFAVVAAIIVLDKTTHQDVIAVAATILICGAVIAWWLVRDWRGRALL